MLKTVTLPLSVICVVPLNFEAVPLCIFACFLISCFTFSRFPSTSHSSSVHFVHSLHSQKLSWAVPAAAVTLSFVLFTSKLTISECTATLSFLLTELSQIFYCIPFSQLLLGCFKNKTPNHVFLLILILGTLSKFCPILFCDILCSSREFYSILLCSASLWCIFHCF